jgi:hypothetical protein
MSSKPVSHDKSTDAARLTMPNSVTVENYTRKDVQRIAIERDQKEAILAGRGSQQVELDRTEDGGGGETTD